MIKSIALVVAFLIVPTLALAQGAQGANALPNGVPPPARPAALGTAPTLAPTKKIDPIYPERARRAGIHGEVWLDVSVKADGTVKSLLIAKSLDTMYGLDQAAAAAVRHWQYPPLTDGRTMRPPMRVVIPFQLSAAPAAVAPVAAPAEFGKDAARSSHPEPGLVLPKLKHEVTPIYTTAGMRAKITGSVTIEAVVMPDGTVGEARVIHSLDAKTGLDDQALGAAREWTFEPGTISGAPVRVIVTLVLTFNLS